MFINACGQVLSTFSFKFSCVRITYRLRWGTERGRGPGRTDKQKITRPIRHAHNPSLVEQHTRHYFSVFGEGN